MKSECTASLNTRACVHVRITRRRDVAMTKPRVIIEVNLSRLMLKKNILPGNCPLSGYFIVGAQPVALARHRAPAMSRRCEGAEARTICDDRRNQWLSRSDTRTSWDGPLHCCGNAYIPKEGLRGTCCCLDVKPEVIATWIETACAHVIAELGSMLRDGLEMRSW